MDSSGAFTASQYAPLVQPGGRIITRYWPDDQEHRRRILAPRSDILDEVEVERSDEQLVYAQEHGPFTTYQRTVTVDDQIVERTQHRLLIPWFGWLFKLPIRAVLARKISARGWWAPPDQLDQTQVLVLGLLAAASVSAAFINTLFTQTAEFAADDFGVAETGIGIAGAVVRAGIIIALPAAFLADRIGRRRVVVIVAWLGPILCVVGALSPSFAFLVVSQALARPMGIALAFLIGVIAAEEMPRNSRAYAISVLAMASGFGAGVAVMSLRLADLGEGGWRLIYVIAAVWCLIALDLTRRLPETRRFEAADIDAHGRPPRLDRRRFFLLAAVAFIGNVFISPASFFQNSYLEDVRGFSGGMIGWFSIVVGTPAAIGLIVGGRIADTRGRRRLIAIALPLSTAAVVAAYSFGGPPLWIFSFLAGVLGSAAFPAMAVYRTELFPTANRSRATGLVTGAALLGGIGGLLVAGVLLDDDWSYSSVMGMLAFGQIIVTVLVVLAYPETAHRELEELNPEDEPVDLDHL